MESSFCRIRSIEIPVAESRERGFDCSVGSESTPLVPGIADRAFDVPRKETLDGEVFEHQVRLIACGHGTTTSPPNAQLGW